jgi:hypothetical protein
VAHRHHPRKDVCDVGVWDVPLKHGVWLPAMDDVDVPTLGDLGVEAEAAGWDGVFVSD